MDNFVPELLSGAGNLEKLKVAVLYGADAVYIGGQSFSLRQAADNFTNDELAIATEFAHNSNVSVYVVLNSFLHDLEISQLPPFLDHLSKIGVDAVIVSDMGVLNAVKQHKSLRIHLSTQASCLSVEAAKFWKKQGVSRIILGREVSIGQAAKIKKATNLEIEMFVHGSMCVSYSGNCTISNYTSGRDSNRGGCAHSCRFEYSLDLPPPHGAGTGTFGEKKNDYFMSSKDLCGIDYIDEFAQAGIDSLKLEGRMKGHLYIGTTTKVYAEALSQYKKMGKIDHAMLSCWKRELRTIPHRDYCSGSLTTPAGSESIYLERENELKEYEVAGFIVEVVRSQYLIMEVRTAFYKGEKLEILPFHGNPIPLCADPVTDIVGNEYHKTKPSVLVKLPFVSGVSKWNIVRKKIRVEGGSK